MLKIWDKTSNLNLPNGEKTPQEIFEEFPFTKNSPALIGEDFGMVGEISSLAVVAGNYDLGENLSDTQLLAEIIKKRQEQKELDSAPQTDNNTPMTKLDAQVLGQALTSIEIAILEKGGI